MGSRYVSLCKVQLVYAWVVALKAGGRVAFVREQRKSIHK